MVHLAELNWTRNAQHDLSETADIKVAGDRIVHLWRYKEGHLFRLNHIQVNDGEYVMLERRDISANEAEALLNKAISGEFDHLFEIA